MDATESVDRKRPRLLEREDDNSPLARISKKVKRESETTLSPVQRKLSEEQEWTLRLRDTETTLSSVQQKFREERECTLRLVEFLSQDQDWFNEERVRAQCLGERLQFFIAENASLITEIASLRERVKYLESIKEALTDSLPPESA
jgi:hypothetical protein